METAGIVVLDSLKASADVMEGVARLKINGYVYVRQLSLGLM